MLVACSRPLPRYNQNLVLQVDPTLQALQPAAFTPIILEYNSLQFGIKVSQAGPAIIHREGGYAGMENIDR